MENPGDGWQTVRATSHAGMERLTRAQLEQHDHQILKEWDGSRDHWSGIGKHTPTDDSTEARKLHARFKVASDTLGSGSYGVVEKVLFHSSNRSIYLARKTLRPLHRRHYVDDMRKEANVMERLDHMHIVKLVGTYCIKPRLYLLLWPVAVCSLDALLLDIDNFRTGRGDHEDITSRLNTLDLTDLGALERPRHGPPAAPHRGNCPLDYLRQIIGCIAQAVAYCHNANIRHLDLKPSNILLNPGCVYLADFGISKDVHNRDNTMTMQQHGTPKWKAPELHQPNDMWSMKSADVYSLGLVMLNIATAIYYAPFDEFEATLGDLTTDGRAEKRRVYLRKLEGLALATQQVEDANAPTFGPKHIVHLVTRMISIDALSRPLISQVASEVIDLGGIDQVYYSHCCKRSSRLVTDRMNGRLKVAADERDRLRTERDQLRTELREKAKRLECLEAKDETYEARLTRERNAQIDTITKLQAQLEKERAQRMKLEEQQKRRHHQPGIPRPAGTRQPGCGRPQPHAPVQQTGRTPPASVTSSHRPAPPPMQVQQPTPAPSVGSSPRPSYAAAIGLPAISMVALPPRRDSLIPTPAPPPPPQTIPAHTPSPDLPGFPLRSRNSGSRLPRAVNPTTPIRCNTPVLHRDPSSADSTQYSMTSSVFSLHRLSLSMSRASLAETSVAGSPTTVQSPVVADDARTTVGPGYAAPESGGEHGLGLGLTERERRESVTSRGGGESVASEAAGFPPASAVMLSPGGSVVSSPRMAHATVKGVRGGLGGKPALPTAKSWADVARKKEGVR
ncbi:kinase-like domain-containing protein [Staphylotrichum tortipilum]|uniref:Kinase-like domain-containing protein n=1 Tax=Staphylotrichum tortipilum TaxID=2831512 RepID=A0AAN6RT04_9PEZI|nr:kinase-like domain-containing protein [Staphylotrichum longicolle]